MNREWDAASEAHATGDGGFSPLALLAGKPTTPATATTTRIVLFFAINYCTRNFKMWNLRSKIFIINLLVVKNICVLIFCKFIKP
jgi:hypothetical protein